MVSNPVGATRVITAADPFPPVEHLRPGIWVVPVPIPANSLRYVYVYVFETDAGPYIVDAGWNTDEAFDALSAGLETVGTSISDVQGILVTHIHPDHYGLAGRVREASGAWVALHPADAALIIDRYDDPSPLLERMAAQLYRMGAPADEIGALQNASMPVKQFVTQVRPDVLLEDGERPDVPGWDLRSIWTPGHSPGHLCFWEPVNEVMLTGDHVLPHITPNIPFHPQAGNDPLGDFLRSLHKLEHSGAVEAWPAHEYRFADLDGRLGELVAHHEERFREALAAIDDGWHTAWEIAERMHWSRPWDQIEGFMRRTAVSEAMAHLRALEVRGVVCEIRGEPSIWERVEDPA